MSLPLRWEYHCVVMAVSEQAINEFIAQGWRYVGLKPLPTSHPSTAPVRAEILFKRALPPAARSG